MSTTFQSIYDLNSVIKNDSRLQGKPKNLIYQLSYNYLFFAIGYFRKKCYQNLDDFTPFSQLEYGFIGSGSTNTYTLSPIPPLAYDGFFISVDDIECTSYTFDQTTNILTINPIPPINSEVYVANYVIGKFNSVILNPTEMLILAEGMSVPFLKQQVNKDTLLNQMVYNSDGRIYSQSAHIDSVSKVSDEQFFKTVKSLINDYTYSENPNGYLGLGGGILNPITPIGGDRL